MPEQVPRKRMTIPWAVIALVLIVSVLAMPVLYELVRSVVMVFDGQAERSVGEFLLSADRFWLLARSVGIAGFIGVIGVCMGIPLGRIISSSLDRLDRRGRWWGNIFAGVLIAPLWLPATMVYAAGNLMRAPDTIIGHALIAYSTSSEDLRWVTIWAGYSVAVVGLAIWSAPIAAVLIASGLGTRSGLYDEMIALEPVGLIGRTWLWGRLHSGVLVRAWVLVTILMLGSAVPMHLAQLETWSIVIWRELSERSIERWGGVWVSSWPMVVIAGIGAWVLTRTAIGRESTLGVEDRGHTMSRVPRKIMILALMVWAMGTLVPMGAMLLTLDDYGSLVQFWRLESGAMRDSGIIALGTGLVTVGIALLCAITLSDPSRRVRRLGALGVLILCILGLIPGVLIGAAIVRFPVEALARGWSGALLASCIRTGFLGAIVGAMGAGSESIERRSVRWQMAGGSSRGWVRAALPAIWMPIVGAGLIGFVYSMYEIEASVMVRPPGMDNLPQQLLSDLHYARLEELSASGINLMVIGLIISIIGSMLIARMQTRQ